MELGVYSLLFINIFFSLGLKSMAAKSVVRNGLVVLGNKVVDSSIGVEYP